MERVCAFADLAEGEVLKVELAGHAPLAATVLEGQAYVFPDTCPHAEESLSEGWVEDGRVICGVHFAEFGLANDEVVNGPVGCGHLLKFVVEVREGDVFANLAGAGAG